MRFFTKKKVMENPPVAVVEPDYKQETSLALSSARNKLLKIEATISTENKERNTAIGENAKALARSEELNTAIAHGKGVLSVGPNERMEGLLRVAEEELRGCKAVISKNETTILRIDGFLGRTTPKVEELRSNIGELEEELANLALRETESNIENDLGDIESHMRSYRRDVFVKEASAELR